MFAPDPKLWQSTPMYPWNDNSSLPVFPVATLAVVNFDDMSFASRSLITFSCPREMHQVNFVPLVLKNKKL